MLIRAWPAGSRRERAAGVGHGLPAQRLVMRRLGRGGLHGDVELGARRQLLQHLRLGPAQHERPDQPLQQVLRVAVAVALDRRRRSAR